MLATSERDDSAVAWLAGDVVRGRVLPDRGRMGGAAVLARGAAGPLSASSNRIGDTAVALVSGGSVGVATYDLPPSAPTLRDLPDVVGRRVVVRWVPGQDFGGRQRYRVLVDGRRAGTTGAPRCGCGCGPGATGSPWSASTGAGSGPAPPAGRSSTCGELAAVPAAVRAGRRARARPLLMGIVNATPDSFSDAGDHPTLEARRAVELLEAGADIIDVGGESASGHHPAVTAEEEIARVVPLIERLAARGATSPSTPTSPRSPRRRSPPAPRSSTTSPGCATPALADVCARDRAPGS